MQNTKLIIGFVTYGDLTTRYLPYFLDSLKSQTFKDFEIFVVDNSEDENNNNVKFIKKEWPEINFEWAGKNLGFAKAYNKIINKTTKINAKYFLMLNPDMILDSGALKIMIEIMEEDSKIESVCPTVLRWDFEKNKKTNIIDTCGIKLKTGLRFVDLGQKENKSKQTCDVEILGPSGAVGMYRFSTLEKIKQNGKVFDEIMFMYKEDCDLVYRLFLAGCKSKIAKDAIIYHDRTAGGKGDDNLQIILNRRNKSSQIKKWSFLNQHIIYFKYWHLQNFWNKSMIIWHVFKMFIFVLIFEQYLLGEYLKLLKIRKKIEIYK